MEQDQVAPGAGLGETRIVAMTRLAAGGIGHDEAGQTGGDLPGDLHEYVVFSIALMAASRQQEAARDLIRFVTSAQAEPLLRKGMMEPASG